MFPELTRKKQALTQEDCIAVLRSAPRGVLSVNGADGYPYGMPMNHWYNPADGKIYFHGGKYGHKIDAIRKSPKASFCVLDEGTPSAEGWWLTFRSVIVFGEIELIEDYDRIIEISRQLSYRFTKDEQYIAHEIEVSGPGTLCFALVPQHICGKRVNER